MTLKKYTELHDAFSSENRVRMLALLLNGPLTPEEFFQMLDMKRANVRQHFEKLQRAGLVDEERLAENRQVRYKYLVRENIDLVKSMIQPVLRDVQIVADKKLYDEYKKGGKLTIPNPITSPIWNMKR